MRPSLVLPLAALLALRGADGQKSRTKHKTAYANFLSLLANGSYNPEEPPLAWLPDGSLSRTDVVLSLTLSKLMNFDSDEGVVCLNANITLSWYEPRLSYNGTELFPDLGPNGSWDSTGKSYLDIDADAIWKPDIRLYEQTSVFQNDCRLTSAHLFDETFGGSQVDAGRMRYNVVWSRSCEISSRCQMNMRMFPFDAHECNLTWGPWAEGLYMVLPGEVSALADAISNQFVITAEFLPYGSYVVYEPPPGDLTSSAIVPAVRTRALLTRYHGYYTTNYILPLFLLLVLSWLAFTIPLDSGDRLAYLVTLILMGMAVVFIVAAKHPPVAIPTWIDKFQVTILVLISIPVAETVVLLRLQKYVDAHVTDQQRYNEGQKLIFAADRCMRILFPLLALLVIFPLFVARNFDSDLRMTLVKLYPDPSTMFCIFAVGQFLLFCFFACVDCRRHGGLYHHSAEEILDLHESLVGDEVHHPGSHIASSRSSSDSE